MIKRWNPLLDSTCSCFCGTNTLFYSLAGFDRTNSSILSSHLIPQGIGEQLAKNQLFFHFSNPIPCRTMPFDRCLLQLLCLWHRPFLRSSFYVCEMAADEIRCWIFLSMGLNWSGGSDYTFEICGMGSVNISQRSYSHRNWNIGTKIDSSKGQSSSVWWFPAKALRGMLTLLHTCS